MNMGILQVFGEKVQGDREKVHWTLKLEANEV
jgi:hypothetical protein